MPSIPQSLLWISLVVLWLFVLVPMLISKRDTVRRTSDVALATRVLNSAANSRLLKRNGPAAGHRSDPSWRPTMTVDDDDLDEAVTDSLDVKAVAEGVGADADESEESEVVAAEEVSAEVVEEVDDDARDETASGDAEAVDAETADAEQRSDGQDTYEYVDDTSGLEAEEEPDTGRLPIAVPAASRQRRYDTKTAAAVTARKYQFRKRALMMLAAALLASAVLAFTAAPAAWWLCGAAGAVTVFYLGYLRRQTRIEEQVRARRARRMARAGIDMEHRAHAHERARRREPEVVPSRLRRPGAVVLEIDDEDPAFEHLEYMPFAREHDWPGDLPRAAGQ